MSNIENLKRGYQAFASGDLETLRELWADDIEWENPSAQQVPNPGVTRGVDAVTQLLADTPKYWEKFELTPNAFFEEGDSAVVLCHIEAKARETGREVSLPAVHVFRIEDGKTKRFQNVFDTATVAEALGRL